MESMLSTDICREQIICKGNIVHRVQIISTIQMTSVGHITYRHPFSCTK